MSTEHYTYVNMPPPPGYIRKDCLNKQPDHMFNINQQEGIAAVAYHPALREGMNLVAVVPGSPYVTREDPKSAHCMWYPHNWNNPAFYPIGELTTDEVTLFVSLARSHVANSEHAIAGFNTGPQQPGIASPQGWRNFHLHLIQLPNNMPLVSLLDPNNEQDGQTAEFINKKRSREAKRNGSFTEVVVGETQSFFDKTSVCIDTKTPNQMHITLPDDVLDATIAGFIAIHHEFCRTTHAAHARSSYHTSPTGSYPSSPQYTTTFHRDGPHTVLTVSHVTEPGGSHVGIVEAIGIWPIRSSAYASMDATQHIDPEALRAFRERSTDLARNSMQSLRSRT